MKRRGILAVFLLGVTLAASALDQRTPTVTFIDMPTVNVARGKSTKIALKFRIAPGFHINSNKPLSDELVPTTLKVSPPTDVIVGRVTYPAGHEFALEGMPPLDVYTGEFSVGAVVTTTLSAPVGTSRVRGTLNFQACNDRQCFPPKQLPVQFDVTVNRGSKASTSSTRGNPGQSPNIRQTAPKQRPAQ